MCNITDFIQGNGLLVQQIKAAKMKALFQCFRKSFRQIPEKVVGRNIRYCIRGRFLKKEEKGSIFLFQDCEAKPVFCEAVDHHKALGNKFFPERKNFSGDDIGNAAVKKEKGMSEINNRIAGEQIIFCQGADRGFS